jgi:chemotaxis-related protein WspB
VLLLLFQLGEDRFALDAGKIIEVLPLISVNKPVRSPPGLAGTLNYHGAFIPVVDLSDLIRGQPSAKRLSTRIVITNLLGKERTERRVGVIIENVTQTLQREAADFVSPGIAAGDAAYLGPIVKTPDGLAQLIEWQRVLSDSLRLSLLDQPAEVA